MNVPATVRQILKQAPGDALCDSCLAFGCATSLTEMREITASLRQDREFMDGSTACVSCRRPTPTTVYGTAAKCAHCSRLLGDDGLGIIVGGDQFHRACWQQLLSDEKIRVSRSLSRESRRLIERARAVMDRPRPEMG
ncbi:MAG TPA: hypothetical protein VGU22_10570 [Methylomirabilota bacterium]|nr:hypothetical protein [Methylomirabilota bacterium]